MLSKHTIETESNNEKKHTHNESNDLVASCSAELNICFTSFMHTLARDILTSFRYRTHSWAHFVFMMYYIIQFKLRAVLNVWPREFNRKCEHYLHSKKKSCCTSLEGYCCCLKKMK